MTPTRAALFASALALALVACERVESDDDDTTVATHGLVVEPVAHNKLSCHVRWSTDVSALGQLTATAEDGESFLWDDLTPVTQHEMRLPGLREGTRYDLWATSRDEDGAVVWQGEGSFETGELPFPMPSIEVVSLDTQRMQPGWTLTSFLVEPDLDHRAAVMLDPDGQVRWYHEFESLGAMAAVEVSLVEDGRHVLIGPLPDEGQRPLELAPTGDVVWEGPPQQAIGVTGYMHHTLQKLADGDYLALFHDLAEGGQADVIEQFSAEGEVVWSWDTRALAADLGSAVWANAVQMDGDAVYLNSRWHSLLYRLDRATGEVIWALGNGGDFTLVGEHEDPWFAGAHATTVLADGHVLTYDNGKDVRETSRVIEYAIDEEALTAQVVWEYPGTLADDPWYTCVWGDVERLANGNTLVTAGSMIDTDSPSRIFEVTPDGTVAWRVDLAGPTAEDRAGVYTARRIPALVALAE